MKCGKCKETIPEDEQCNYLGQIVCEDCYIAAIEPPRTCDVAAVHSATTHRAAAGQTGTEGLTELQKNVYEYIEAKGKATKQEIREEFSLSPRELEKLIATMRHCELLKGRKIDNEIYLVLFDLE